MTEIQRYGTPIVHFVGSSKFSYYGTVIISVLYIRWLVSVRSASTWKYGMFSFLQLAPCDSAPTVSTELCKISCLNLPLHLSTLTAEETVDGATTSFYFALPYLFLLCIASPKAQKKKIGRCVCVCVRAVTFALVPRMLCP